MKKFYKLFSVRTTPVWTHWSIPLVLPLLVIPAFGTATTWFSPVESLLVTIILVASLLLAELAQILVAMGLGIRIKKIVLLPLNSLTYTNGSRQNHEAQMLSHLAAPLTNLLIALAAFAGLPLAARQAIGSFAFNEVAPGLLYALFVINLGLFVLQLLPALPLKGGQLVKRLAIARLGRQHAYRIIIPLGMATAALLIVAGAFSSFFLCFVGGLVLVSNLVETETEKQREFIEEFTARNVMNTHIVLVSPQESIRDVLRRPRFWNKELVVVENQKVLGVISPLALARLCRAGKLDVALSQVMYPEIKTVRGKHRLADLYAEAHWEDCAVYAVADKHKVVGILRINEIHTLLAEAQKEYGSAFTGLSAMAS